MIKISFKRRLLKTISWRFVAALLTFVTVAFFANYFTALILAGVASLSDLIVKTSAYYLHEHLWDKSKFGLEIDIKEGACIWITGLPCSGKTTIAIELVNQLEKRLIRTEYLDGDIVRKSVCADLGFSKEDRDENIKRVTFVASYLSKKAITVCSFVSPYKSARQKAREKINNFLEVFV